MKRELNFFLYQLENLVSFTGDSRMIRDKVQHHFPSSPQKYVETIKAHYKPKILASKSSDRRRDESCFAEDSSRIAYSFNCGEDDCSPSFLDMLQIGCPNVKIIWEFALHQRI